MAGSLAVDSAVILAKSGCSQLMEAATEPVALSKLAAGLITLTATWTLAGIEGLQDRG